MDRRFSLIGPGRAGGALAKALVARGWSLERTVFKQDDPSAAAQGVDLCVVATPDEAIAHTAELIEPGEAVVIHLSGVTPVSVLSPHRAGALHPLVALPDPDTGAARLGTAWFGVGGDELAAELARELSGKWFHIADDDRALYHAAAVVASNHVTAVLGQAERIAAEVGVPFDALLTLVRASVENIAALGPARALTGPASRGDDATIAAHVTALEERLPEEVATYVALAEETRRLAAHRSAE